MPSRSGAVHVATTKRIYKGKTYRSHLLRRTFRKDGKVLHETLGNLSHLPDDLIDVIRQRLKSRQPLADSGEFRIERSLPHGHVEAILQSINKLGLARIVDPQQSRHRDIILACIVMRLLRPASKMATTRLLDADTAVTSVGWQLELGRVKPLEVYQALDWLVSRQEKIEKKLAAKHLTNGSIVLYDLTSSYYTGSRSSLVKYGYNRDGKSRYPQITFGLLCTEAGCPVAVKVFAGNTADPATMPEQIRVLREQYGLRRIIWVGDRGMLTSKCIDAYLRDQEGMDWITALRSAQIQSLMKGGAIQLSLFDKQDLADMQSDSFPGERLIVCRNPLLADKRNATRQNLIQATGKLLDEVQNATQRSYRPLKGKEAIGLRVGKVINKYKVAKHFKLEIKDNSFTYSLDKEKIAQEQMLDGLYVIRTSLPVDSFSAHDTVKTYKRLAHVEQAFRSIKTVHLRVRPIFHWDDDRIKAHIFLCMLAYYVKWHMMEKLSPFLYADHEKEQAQRKRTSIVAPAVKSDAALKKAASHRTEEGVTVHSFTTLMEDLGTICKNKIRTNGKSATFFMITQPTQTQKQILKIMEVKL